MDPGFNGKFSQEANGEDDPVVKAYYEKCEEKYGKGVQIHELPQLEQKELMRLFDEGPKMKMLDDAMKKMM